MYVWHKEAKSKKFKVIIELPSAYQVLLDHHFQHLPKAEYEECPPPEPLKSWRDVTDELHIDSNQLLARFPDGGMLVLNPYHIPPLKTRRLVMNPVYGAMGIARTALFVEEFR